MRWLTTSKTAYTHISTAISGPTSMLMFQKDGEDKRKQAILHFFSWFLPVD